MFTYFLLIQWITFVFIVQGQTYEPLAISKQPIPLIKSPIKRPLRRSTTTTSTTPSPVDQHHISESNGITSIDDETDYDYRNDQQDWIPPPPPPPPVAIPPPITSISSGYSTFSGFRPISSSYALPTQTSYDVLPRRRPFGPYAAYPYEQGRQHDEFTLFLVILTVAGFFGLIISMFMPFTLLLQSQTSALGPINGLSPLYPVGSTLGATSAQFGTGAMITGRKRRRRNSQSFLAIMNSIHDSSIKYRNT